jgi:hypothetical protein
MNLVIAVSPVSRLAVMGIKPHGLLALENKTNLDGRV